VTAYLGKDTYTALIMSPDLSTKWSFRRYRDPGEAHIDTTILQSLVPKDLITVLDSTN